MTTIGYDSIENVLLSISDPNTGGAMTQVPGVSSPKINGSTSIYNVQANGKGIAGWSTNVSWSSTDYNTVSRGSGNIYLPDGTSYAVTSGNTGDMSSTTYIYYDMDTSTVGTTTSASASVGEKKLLLCVASPTTSGKSAEYQAFGTNDQSTFIYASNIAANTITGNEIAANSITSNELSVYQLSAITSSLGDVNVGNNNDSKIRIRPNGNQGRIDFSYEGTTVGSMIGTSISGPGDTLGIIGGSNGNGNIALYGSVWCLGKLRIPVGTNLY